MIRRGGQGCQPARRRAAPTGPVSRVFHHGPAFRAAAFRRAS